MKSFYSEHPTWLHRIPASAKLFGLLVLSVVLFNVNDLQTLLWLTLCTLVMFVSLGRCVVAAKGLLIGMAVASVLIMGFHLYMDQWQLGSVSVLRLFSATLLGIALTLSTRQTDLLIVFEALFSPLQRVGVRPQQLALQLALMLRFTEHFFMLWRKLDEAHRLRTGQPGGFKILAPLTIQMLMTARRVADTLDVRLHR